MSANIQHIPSHTKATYEKYLEIKRPSLGTLDNLREVTHDLDKKIQKCSNHIERFTPPAKTGGKTSRHRAISMADQCAIAKERKVVLIAIRDRLIDAFASTTPLRILPREIQNCIHKKIWERNGCPDVMDYGRVHAYDNPVMLAKIKRDVIHSFLS